VHVCPVTCFLNAARPNAKKPQLHLSAFDSRSVIAIKLGKVGRLKDVHWRLFSIEWTVSAGRTKLPGGGGAAARWLLGAGQPGLIPRQSRHFRRLPPPPPPLARRRRRRHPRWWRAGLIHRSPRSSSSSGSSHRCTVRAGSVDGEPGRSVAASAAVPPPPPPTDQPSPPQPPSPAPRSPGLRLAAASSAPQAGARAPGPDRIVILV